MKDGLCTGLVLGALIGMLLYKHSDDAQEVFDKGEQMAKKEIKNLQKNMQKE